MKKNNKIRLLIVASALGCVSTTVAVLAPLVIERNYSSTNNNILLSDNTLLTNGTNSKASIQYVINDSPVVSFSSLCCVSNNTCYYWHFNANVKAIIINAQVTDPMKYVANHASDIHAVYPLSLNDCSSLSVIID
jgi:hypothetical protein